jgi:arabinogalactan endo-1,4-beta-galactosidase
MKISEEFPSKYLKASDLGGREVKVIMANVEREKLGDDSKPVLYFKGKEKGVVLNKTNSNTIADAYGDDTDEWFDQEIILFSVMVDFNGKVSPSIRMRVPTAKDRKKDNSITSGPQPAKSEQLTDDEIPF